MIPGGTARPEDRRDAARRCRRDGDPVGGPRPQGLFGGGQSIPAQAFAVPSPLAPEALA